MFGRKRSRSVAASLPAVPIAEAIEHSAVDPAPPEDADASAAGSGFYFPPGGEMLIGEGVAITGEIRDCRRLVIAGTFSGTLLASEVIVLTKASLNADVVADRVDIFGSLNGEIIAAESVQFRESAVFDGRLVYGELLVDPGAQLSGELSQVATEEEQAALGQLESFSRSRDDTISLTGEAVVESAETVTPARSARSGR
jgi:cytoskeletal protein CcmA (bactofilin family)